MLVFLLFFLALAYVSPFAPDFDMVSMYEKSHNVSEADMFHHVFLLCFLTHARHCWAPGVHAHSCNFV